MANFNPIVRNEVIETSFSLYTDDDIRALSVCKIVSPVALDSLGNPLCG
jgi:DNA-directed RNA polymerase beta' subunit